MTKNLYTSFKKNDIDNIFICQIFLNKNSLENQNFKSDIINYVIII